MSTLCIDVYPRDRNVNRMRRILVNRHGFTEKQNHIGSYFTVEVPTKSAWQTTTMLKFHGFEYRSYNKRYARASNYRKTFFEENKGPYRCAYCGKRLSANNLEVDHLIPVAKAKSETSVRALLQICGMKNVNDSKNLVASCHKCNHKKLDKMGFWVIRGFVGRHRIVWTIRDVILTIAIILITYWAFTTFPIIEYLKNLLAQI